MRVDLRNVSPADQSGAVTRVDHARARRAQAWQTAFDRHCSDVNLPERITIDPAHCGGKPCIRGMRIQVKDVLEMLGSDMTEPDILEEYPYLQAEDIRASQLYAAQHQPCPNFPTSRSI